MDTRTADAAVFLEEHLGLALDDADRARFRNVVERTCGELGLRSGEELSFSSPLLPALVRRLTVGETYFFRDPLLFRELEERVLPERIRSREADRTLRCWSAGCSSGEEAYSLAILMERLLPPEWDGTILATDVNPAFLEKGRQGVYSAWSFRETPLEIRRRWFTETDGRWSLDPALKRKVAFREMNLAREFPPALFPLLSDLDLILCRNVMIYFRPTVREALLERLVQALRPGGWLALTPVEAPHARLETLGLEGTPGSSLYRKPELRTAPPSLPVPPPPEPRKEEPPLPPPVTAEPENTVEENEAATLYLLGTALEEAGEEVRAKEAYRKALYLDPSLVMSHLALAHRYAGEGRRREAARHLEKSLELLEGRESAAPVPLSGGWTAGGLLAFVRQLLEEKGA